MDYTWVETLTRTNIFSRERTGSHCKRDIEVIRKQCIKCGHHKCFLNKGVHKCCRCGTKW